MFTADWTSPLEQSLTQLFHADITTEMKCIEVGCFEGKGSLLILNKLCSHPNSQLYCIDHWENTYILENNTYSTEINNYFIGQYERFKSNTIQYKDKIIELKGHSDTMLTSLQKNTVDFVYIDGDHSPEQVYKDAIHSFELLKSGGIIVFDDYLGEYKGIITKHGIDRFYEEKKNECKVLFSNYQFGISKN
jgi:predicted O-methyltransferase YrrM